MNASIDISLYPLNQDYLPAIDAFIRALKQYPDITVLDVLMAPLQTEIRESFVQFGQGVFTLKILKENFRRKNDD